MRAIAALLAGEALLLAGLALWSVPLALVVGGGQLAAFGLVSEIGGDG